MTQVFLLMWLADFADSVAVIGGVSATIFCLSMGIGAIVAGVCWMDGDGTGTKHKEILRGLWRYTWWLLIPIGIATVFPTKNTIRLLAVTSAADAVSHTVVGEKSMEAINAVLDRIIKEAKK